MMRLVCERAPLGQIVGSLLLDVRLRVYAVLASKFLCDGILDLDSFDGFAEIGEGVAPSVR